jgi:hypothetical protein
MRRSSGNPFSVFRFKNFVLNQGRKGATASVVAPGSFPFGKEKQALKQRKWLCPRRSWGQ